LFGTCAGAILLAREVRGPSQRSLGLLDATIERNAYGRQVDSFEVTLEAPLLGAGLPAVFIRAPRFVALGPEVEVLACHGQEPVLVRQGSLLAATFHPEIAAESRLHRLFADLATRRADSHPSPGSPVPLPEVREKTPPEPTKPGVGPALAGLGGLRMDHTRLPMGPE
jgi:5'-phosphate synthase pdxT subunit